MSNINRTAAALLMAALAAPGVAGAQTITTSVAVKRVAVHSEADAHRLQRRIADAALEACGASGFSAAEYRDAVTHSACYSAAIAQANATAGTMTAAATPSDTGTANP
jgi:UrcA family protein